jgi:hypothetical protein
VLLTTPTTPTDRMKEIAKASEGFLYLVSVQLQAYIFCLTFMSALVKRGFFLS